MAESGSSRSRRARTPSRPAKDVQSGRLSGRPGEENPPPPDIELPEPEGDGSTPAVQSLDINIIRVGVENFTSNDELEISNAINITRSIFSNVQINLRTVSNFQISLSDAGSNAVIDNESEAKDVTNDWSVDNDALDVFVVRAMTDADGRSPVDGNCDKDVNKEMTGSVVSLNGDSANVGNTLAHEIGHYLGLDHVPDSGNFIGGNGSSDSWTGIFAWQGNIMRTHCFVG